MTAEILHGNRYPLHVHIRNTILQWLRAQNDRVVVIMSGLLLIQKY